MNLDYLRTYLEVIRLGSFSEAARKLSITQPAVSFQINKLEHDLGVRLIDRGQKSINMTDAGKRLLSFAELIEQERDHLSHDIDQIREDITGNIVIAASTIPGEVLLLPILNEFKALHPATSAKVEASDSLGVISGVQAGDYDVGFCGIAPEGGDLDYFKFAEDEIVLIVFPEHPFSQRKDISFLEIEGESLISREETSGTQGSLRSLLASSDLDLDKLSTVLILGTTQAVVSAVEARIGIAFVSNLAIEKSLALGLVKAIAIKEVKLRRDFYCVYRRKRVVSRLVNEFIAFVRSRTLQT